MGTQPSPTVLKSLTTTPKSPHAVGDKALYRVSEAMATLSMSRTVIYEQIRTGRLRTVKQGRARLIPASAIAEYVRLLERESEGLAA